MGKLIARPTSAVLALCATMFVAILKPMFHSPEVPKMLRK